MSAAAENSGVGRRSSATSSDVATSSGSMAPGRWSTSQMESSVTRLLVATKQLLEALTRWSLRNRCTESDVSDIYVRLGNDFNSAKLAFQSYGISMDDLASVPTDLRTCLEECLSEEASPQVLEVHLPRIREIIIGLLQGLKMKQAEYKQLLFVQRANSTASTSAPSGASSSANTAAAASASAQGGAHVAGPRPQRGVHQASDSIASIPGSAVAQSPIASAASSSSAAQAAAKQPSLRALRSRDALERRASKRFSTYTFSKITGASHHQLGHGPTSSGLAQLAHLGMGPGVSAGAAAAAAGLHSNDSGPASSASSVNGVPAASGPPSAAVSSASTPTGPPPIIRRESSSQGTPTSTRRTTLLHQSSTHRRTESSAPAQRAEPETPTSGIEEEEEVLSDRAHSTEVSSRHARTGSVSSQRSGRNSPQKSTRHPPFAPVTLTDPPVPPAPQTPVAPARKASISTSVPASSAAGPSTLAPAVAPPPRPPLTGEIEVFVQQGRQTKRATISLSVPLSIARLRMLFIDKFGYSPGKDDFPPIYVKDQKSGIDYELEESELMQVNTLGIDRAGGVVKDGMLLSLNIEPLDQVKQHLDLTLGNLTREVRELKTAFQEREREARRTSRNYGILLDPNASLNPDASALSLSPLPSPKISDSQFAAAGQRMIQMRRANTLAASKGSNGPLTPQRSDSGLTASERADHSNGTMRALSPQPTGSSISSHAAGLAALELKTHHDEIARLRREFAILAQVQNDFSGEFKGLLGQLRAKAGKVREIANQNVSIERNFIVAGKAKLDTTSQEVLTSVEDLQDTVDDLKLDVIQRGVKPKPALLKKISEDIEKAVSGVEELEKYVHSVKPNWKKTWEVELQNIVDEQEFLNHEEGLLSDLREDCTALKEVFDNIQQVVKLRVASARAGSGGRGYLPPPPEEGHEGLDTVMLEVRSQAVDHDKRLRALEAAEEKRQREMASHTNEFADELAGFVEGKALKRTGGHVEAERLRQKRNDATLRAMFASYEGGPA
ncbi:Bud site selection protein 6 [Tilletia horrida]|nr:Bud site selection protein 6 [Tilletia horrida]